MSRPPRHRRGRNPVETGAGRADAVAERGPRGRTERATPGRRALSARGAGVFGFVLRFGLFWALALVVLSQVPALERWAVDSTVANLTLLLRAVAANPVVSRNFLSAGGASIEIVPDCTSLMPTLVFWSAVAAFPMPWRRKVPGLLMGAAAVWVFNLLRVMALIAVLWWMPRHFKFVHVYLWQAGTLLVVTAMFMYWVRLQVPTLAAR